MSLPGAVVVATSSSKRVSGFGRPLVAQRTVIPMSRIRKPRLEEAT